MTSLSNSLLLFIIIINVISCYANDIFDSGEIIQDLIDDITTFTFSALMGVCFKNAKCAPLMMSIIVLVFFITVAYIMILGKLRNICNYNIKLRRLISIMFGFETGQNYS